MIKGLIFDIKRFAVHDGPGIRTTVFLKGCSLRCFWCQNPEGLNLKHDIMFYPERCIGCGRCVNLCPQKAHIIQNHERYYLRDRCIECGLCAENCYAGALQLVGKWMTVDEVIRIVLMDKEFYDISNGGVTLSGGDPVVQHEFAHALLKQCKGYGLHTAIETAANCQWSVLANILPVTDLIMMDIKHMDPDVHRKATGVTNKLILNNAKKLAESNKPLIIRIPIIQGINDNIWDIEAIAKFVQPFKNLQSLELIPFHKLGEVKYQALGIEYKASHLQAPSKGRMQELAEAAREYVPNTRIR